MWYVMWWGNLLFYPQRFQTPDYSLSRLSHTAAELQAPKWTVSEAGTISSRERLLSTSLTCKQIYYYCRDGSYGYMQYHNINTSIFLIQISQYACKTTYEVIKLMLNHWHQTQLFLWSVSNKKNMYLQIWWFCSPDGNVGLSVHHFGPDWNVSTTIGWIAMKFCRYSCASEDEFLMTKHCHCEDVSMLIWVFS